MTRVSTPERLPNPPEDYDPDYMRRLIDRIEAGIRSASGRRTVLATRVNISDLPTSTTDLRPGDLWSDSGTVKVVS